MEATKPIYGLILAGGKSRRMGRDKALMKLVDNKTQIEYLSEVLNPVCEQVFLSQRKEQGFPCPPGIDIINDSIGDVHGPLCGILSAQEKFPESHWLVVACDLPFITEETARNLVEQFRSLEEPSLIAYKSTYDGLPEPLCAIYPSGSGNQLKARAEAIGKHCPRKLLILQGAILINQLNPKSLENMNTLEDVESSVKTFSK